MGSITGTILNILLEIITVVQLFKSKGKDLGG